VACLKCRTGQITGMFQECDLRVAEVSDAIQNSLVDKREFDSFTMAIWGIYTAAIKTKRMKTGAEGNDP
jgi:hypothetical protein